MNYFVFILWSGSWKMNFHYVNLIIFQCITGQFNVKSRQCNRHSWGQEMEKNCFFPICLFWCGNLVFLIVDRFNTYLSFLSGWYNNHTDFFLLLWLISLEREMKYKAQTSFQSKPFPSTMLNWGQVNSVLKEPLNCSHHFVTNETLQFNHN